MTLRRLFDSEAETVTLPTFSGKEDVVSFIVSLDDYFEAEEVPDICRVAIARECLEQPIRLALDWLEAAIREQLGRNWSWTWTGFKFALTGIRGITPVFTSKSRDLGALLDQFEQKRAEEKYTYVGVSEKLGPVSNIIGSSETDYMIKRIMLPLPKMALRRKTPSRSTRQLRLSSLPAQSLSYLLFGGRSFTFARLAIESKKMPSNNHKLESNVNEIKPSERLLENMLRYYRNNPSNSDFSFSTL